jgi:hypothetical protein
MKKIITNIIVMALLVLPLGVALPVIANATALPNWNVVGSYQLLSLSTYSHDVVITTQNPDGTFSGTGGYPSGSSPYTADGQTTETITGQVIGDSITLSTLYAGPYNPGYTSTVHGTIAPDGTMSGTDPLEWHSTLGHATAITPFTHTQKNLTTWVPYGTTADVLYSTDLNGKFSASGVPSGYTLVYYPDPGAGPFTGEVYPVIGTNMNLPMASDLVGIANGGAKLWLLPNADVSGAVNADGSQTLNWGDASNFLFETSLMNHTATPITHTQKNLTTWAPILPGKNADVVITTVAGTLHTDGVPTGYTLVYYPNVGTYSNYTGEVYPVEGTNMNLPMANDLNGISGSSDYCTNGFNPSATPCVGAKLWLVPSADVSATINTDGSRTLVGDWNTIAPNFLFEKSLMTYTATPPTAPASVITNPATVISSTDATLNGVNASVDATGHSFWVSLSPSFDISSPTIPVGVYSTPDLGPITAGTAFSAQLSSVNGLPAVTAGTPYYFVAWSLVNDIWTPGQILSFTTTPTEGLLGSMQAQDFGVMDVSGVKGYTAGFGVTDATLAGATSIIVQLYSGNTMLQTDTAIIPKFNTNITGTQFSSPFDVFGTFNYVTDGYWTNVRGSEHGQTLIPTRVVATVTLANGKVVTAENTNLTGDLTTIGILSGTVTGGTEPQGNGVLAVTGITAVKTIATADGTFPNGWEYTFDITVPTNETHLSMDFADWLNGTNVLPVANNMRISSAQASSLLPVMVTGAGVFTTPTLDMIGDLDPLTAGKQVQVKVEVAVPATTVNGPYTTTYGIKTN